MNWANISYQDKLTAIKEILEDISYDDITFAWFKAILTVEPTPSEKYLDSCYNVIRNLINISTTEQSVEWQKFHDTLVQREKSIHEKEMHDKEQDHTDDILQWL